MLTKTLQATQNPAALVPRATVVVIPSEVSLDVSHFCCGDWGFFGPLCYRSRTRPIPYLSNFPGLAALHPLVFLLGIVAAVFIFRRKFDLQSLISYTLISFVIFLIFSAQQPQWWVLILPLGFVYALVSEKYSLGTYMLAFGTMTAFLILSFTQGSGYMLFGSAKFNSSAFH